MSINNRIKRVIDKRQRRESTQKIINKRYTCKSLKTREGKQVKYLFFFPFLDMSDRFFFLITSKCLFYCLHHGIRPDVSSCIYIMTACRRKPPIELYRWRNVRKDCKQNSFPMHKKRNDSHMVKLENKYLIFRYFDAICPAVNQITQG